MVDHTTETLQLQNRRDDEEYARELLCEQDLNLDKDTIPWILNHIDCFVSQSEGNESIEEVVLYPYSVNGHDYEVLEKVGKAIGNLQALKALCIASENNHDSSDEDDDDDDDEEVVPPILDCEMLARILSHVRQRITMDITEALAWDVEESRLLVRAIHGHPTITGFDVGRNFPHESSDALYSALATLPALEAIRLCRRQIRAEDESPLAHPESLTELLRVPSLRSVGFDFFDFTPALSRATANALMEGTVITTLEFISCTFPEGGSAAVLANALTRNTSVSYIEVDSPFGGTLNGALAAALPLNSMWRDLVLSGRRFDDDDFSPVLLALGKNTALKTLALSAFGSMDESLCKIMQDVFGTNETLESLELNGCRCDENAASMWCRALSFLRTNKALKSLAFFFNMDVTESCISTLRRDIAAMLQDNASLESLSIRKGGYRTEIMKAEDYIAIVTALQHNTTLKSLDLRGCGGLTLTHDEDMQMAALLKKNYALESLPGINLKKRTNDVLSILRLNGVGRRYLVQDGSSISKGVEVLSRVNNSINCVFLHLLENPRLCDRSAVEEASADESNSRSTNPTASSGVEKREQASAHTGNESRRKLE
jgi:hypothetical protein